MLLANRQLQGKATDTALTHLKRAQRSELSSVLDELAICLSDKSGLCTGAVHRIETTAEFNPKRMLAYRIPVFKLPVFKPDVEKQIGELLDIYILSSSDRQSVRWPVRSFARPREWRGTSGCGLSVFNSFTVADAYRMVAA